MLNFVWFEDRVWFLASVEGRRKARLPTHISLVNWTDQGIRTVKDTLNRRGQAEALAEKHGVRFEPVYWTTAS